MVDLPATAKLQIRRAFERAAHGYDEAATLQRAVRGRLADRLTACEGVPARILDAGSGTGGGAQLLRTRFPGTPVVELDIAAAMLHVARAKHGAVLGVCGDIERLPLRAGEFELAWSNLALQWAMDLDRALAELRRVLAPQGMLLFSTLAAGTLRELRQAFEDDDAHVNSFVTAQALQQALARRGYAAIQVEQEAVTMRYAQVRDVMRDLKAIGAQTVTAGRASGLMSRARWQRFEANYERLRSGGTLPATYEVLYVRALRQP